MTTLWPRSATRSRTDPMSIAGKLDDALDRIDRTPDCQTFDDLRVGGKTYMIEEVGPEIDASTEDRELEARFQEAMRQSDRALGYEP